MHVHVLFNNPPFFCILHADADSNSDDDTDDEEDSILKRAGTLLTRKSDYLAQGSLDIRRVKDANSEKPSNVRKHCNDSCLAMTERKTEKISDFQLVNWLSSPGPSCSKHG